MRDLGVESVHTVGAVDRVLATQRRAGRRVATSTEEKFHLLGSHDVASIDALDPGEASTDPVAGCLALGCVIVGQRHPALLGRVERGDLPGQVLIPRPGRQLV